MNQDREQLAALSNHADLSGVPLNDVTLMNPALVKPEPLPPEGTPINQFETRGYEIAKLLRDGSWESVGKYRDTELGLSHANAMCKQMNAMGFATYQVRVLVSCELPKQLVLDADEPAEVEAVTGRLAEGTVADSTPSTETDPASPE